MADSRLASLTRASARLTAAPTLAEAIAIAAEEARAIIGAHQSAIHLSVDGQAGQALHHVSLSDKYAGWRDRDPAATHARLRRLLPNGNGPLRLTQAQLEKHPHWAGAGGTVDDGPPLRGCLAAPLGNSGREPAGLIYLSDKSKGNFTAEDALVLAQLADLASLAVRNFHLREAVGSAAAGAARPPAGIEEEASFRYLFDKNPTPMWVYDLGSLAFLEVNQAALQHYGYSRAEFLAMRITDIRPTEDVPRLMDLIADRAPGLRYCRHLAPSPEGRNHHRCRYQFGHHRVRRPSRRSRRRPRHHAAGADRGHPARHRDALRGDRAERPLRHIYQGHRRPLLSSTTARSKRVFHISGDEFIGKTIHDVIRMPPTPRSSTRSTAKSSRPASMW